MQPRYVIFAALTLAGCAQSSGAMRMGPDTYSVSVHAAPVLGGVTGAQRRALQEAAETCAAQGREMLVTNMSSGRSSHLPGGTVEATFQCLRRGDPDLTRPSYRQAPNVVIESR